MTKMVIVPVLTLALLAGCGKPVPGVALPAAPATPGVGETWELVTLKRSDPPSIYTVVERDVSHAMCADMARLRNRQVVPFPPIPDDYEDERVTRITNGVSTVMVTETTAGDDPVMDMENCAYRLKSGKTKVVTISHAGKSTVIVDGKVTETEDIPPWPAHAPRGKSTERFTLAQTVNGVKMRCEPPSALPHLPDDKLALREHCVYHLDNVMVDESGDPVIVRSHVLSKLFPKFPFVSKDEPQSMRRIGPGEPDPYQVSTWVK